MSRAQLFNGYAAHLFTYPLFWPVFFVSKSTLEREGCPKIGASFAAGIAATTIANPAFVVKTRSQASSDSIGKVAKQVFVDKAFMRGWGATQLNSAKLGVQMPLYDVLVSEKVGMGVAPAALVSKGLVSTLFYPFDLIRTLQRVSGNSSIIDTARTIMSSGSGLYRGLGAYTAATLPNFVLLMVFKDWVLA